MHIILTTFLHLLLHIFDAIIGTAAIQPEVSQPKVQLPGQQWSKFTQPPSGDGPFPPAPLKSQPVSNNKPGSGLPGHSINDLTAASKR